MDGYGVITYALSITLVLNILSDFGFSISATKKVAENINSKGEVNRIIGGVFFIKFWLSIISVLILIIYGLLSVKYNEYSYVFYLSIIPLLAMTYQPIWLFHGLEKMRHITLYSVAAKSLYLVFILILVKDEADIYYVPIANGVSQFIALLLSMISMNRLGYKAVVPDREMVLDLFKESIQYFGSRASVAIYSTGGILLLGNFSTSVNVAVYSIAEQLYKAVQFAFMPLNQAMFPYMTKKKNTKIFKNIFFTVVFFLVLVVCIGYFITPYFLNYYLGIQNDIDTIINVFNLFLIVLLFSIPSTFLGYPLFTIIDKVSYVNKAVMLTALVYFFSCLYLFLLKMEIVAITLVLVLLFSEAVGFMLKITFYFKAR